MLRTLAAVVVSALALPAMAQTQSTPRIDSRQAKQERRIEQGEKSGALTAKEAAQLEKGQAKVRKMENRAAADGKITAREREHIEHAQNKQSARIYREKHDKQKAR